MTSFPPNQEKTNEDLSKNLLENQITNMLNQIMNEENEENNEDSSSPPNKSPSFVKTEHPSSCRVNKKYPTIGSMHTQKNILPQFNINNSDYYMQFPFNNNNFQNMCFTPANLMMYQNNFQQVFPPAIQPHWVDGADRPTPHLAGRTHGAEVRQVCGAEPGR
jgi:hypothetical protein